MGEQPLTRDSLVSIMLKVQTDETRWPLLSLRHTPQDGDSVGVAEAAHSFHHSAPNATLCHPPLSAVTNPAMEEEKKNTIQTRLPQRHLAAINTQA